MPKYHAVFLRDIELHLFLPGPASEIQYGWGCAGSLCRRPLLLRPRCQGGRDCPQEGVHDDQATGEVPLV